MRRSWKPPNGFHFPTIGCDMTEAPPDLGRKPLFLLHSTQWEFGLKKPRICSQFHSRTFQRGLSHAGWKVGFDWVCQNCIIGGARSWRGSGPGAPLHYVDGTIERAICSLLLHSRSRAWFQRVAEVFAEGTFLYTFLPKLGMRWWTSISSLGAIEKLLSGLPYCRWRWRCCNYNVWACCHSLIQR